MHLYDNISRRLKSASTKFVPDVNHLRSIYVLIVAYIVWMRMMIVVIRYRSYIVICDSIVMELVLVDMEIFQREEEFHLATTAHLVRLQNAIQRGSLEAEEMFANLKLTINARNDVTEARKVVKDNLDGHQGFKGLAKCKASVSNLRRIQVKDIIKEVKDYLKTYSLAGMDISWYEEGIRCGFKHSQSDLDVEEDLRSSSEFIADLNVEYHERALLANQKRFYKRYGRVGYARKPMDKSNEICFASKKIITKKIDAMSKGKSEKGLVAESFDWDEESVSSEDEGTTKIKAFMAIAEEEPSVGKADARSGHYEKVTLGQLLSEQVPGNIVKALEGRGKRKEKISSKEVIFTKADESSSMPILEITSDSKSECETHEPLPPLSKLIGAAPTGTLNSLISLADLTLNMADLTLNTSVPKKTKLTSNKVSHTYAIKKKTETKSPAIPFPQPEKKADLSAEQLLLTLMDEVKSLKEQIKVPSENTLSISQTGSSKSSKGKQTTWFGPCKHYGFKNHLAKDCYIKPKCSTCGYTNYLTKEHLEQTIVNKTLTKLKAQSSMNPLAKKALMIPKPFKDCKYNGFNDHHSDNYEYYPGCEVCDSGCSRHITEVKQYLHRYSKELGHNVVFEDNSSGDKEGYDSVNCDGITFTRRDVYVIDITSYNEESGNGYRHRKTRSPTTPTNCAQKRKEVKKKSKSKVKVKVNHKSQQVKTEPKTKKS
ncbi:hypothetical protein Tco_1477050 [Tanacetum coccineum]